MLIKKVVISVPPALQKALFNELKAKPLIEPVTAHQLITVDFQDNAMHDALRDIEEKVRNMLGEKYWKTMRAKAHKNAKTPYEILKKWEECLIGEKERLAEKMNAPAENTPEKEEEIKKFEKKLNRTAGDAKTGDSHYREKYASVINYFNGEQFLKGKPAPTPRKIWKNEPGEMAKNLDSIILEVEKPINSIFEAMNDEQRLLLSLERLLSNSDLHLFISVLEGKRHGYERITVSTNLGGICRIEKNDIRNAIYEPVFASGYVPEISFEPVPKNYAGIPYLGVTAGGTNGIASSMLRSIADIAEWATIKR